MLKKEIIPVVLPSVCDVCPRMALYRCLLIKSPKYFSIWKGPISFQHCAIHSSWFGCAAAAEAFHSWIPWVRVPTFFFPGSQTSDMLNFLHRLRHSSKTKPLFLWSISAWEFPVTFSKIPWLTRLCQGPFQNKLHQLGQQRSRVFWWEREKKYSYGEWRKHKMGLLFPPWKFCCELLQVEDLAPRLSYFWEILKVGATDCQ